MKQFLCLTATLFAACRICAQTSTDEHEWKAMVKVVDENGTPVAKADVKVGYYSNNTSIDIEGTTDTNGIFAAKLGKVE